MKTPTYTLQKISFLVLFILFLVLAIFLLWPFLQLIFLAAILAILFLPIQKFLAKKLKNNTLCALLLIIVILAVIITPLYFLGQATIQSSLDFYSQYKEGTIKIDSQLLINRFPAKWQTNVLNLIDDASRMAGNWINNFNLDIQTLLSNIAYFCFSFFLFFFTLFYLLKDHHKLKTYFDRLVLFSNMEESLIIEKVTQAVNGVIRGNFLIALLQGVAATSGFALAGFPQPIFFGLVTVVSAFIPAIGTSLIIIPALIYLLLFKSLTSALILAVWYVVIHLSIDNIVGPKLIGAQNKVHPLLILFSIIGGLELFGALGFLFGPIIMTIFVSLLDIYLVNHKKN